MADHSSSPSTPDPSTTESQQEPPRDRIAELEANLKDSENKYLYLYADFENFKKRSVKERSDFLKYGWEPLARDLLEVLDNLKRAAQHAESANPDSVSFRDGVQMILEQFQNSLKKRGVAPIEAIGKVFDPNLHEAVGQEPSDLPPGSITREELTGYLIHDRLLRPARVVTSMGPGTEKTN